MKRKIISAVSMIAAIWGTLVAVEADNYGIALICLAWVGVWTLANGMKKPRAATRSNSKKLYLYDIKNSEHLQEEVSI